MNNLLVIASLGDSDHLKAPAMLRVDFFLELCLYCVRLLKVTVVRNEEGGNSVSTVVLRGSTDSILDDLERAVDGLNTYKVVL
ncbi:hypothetical protein C3L33_02087, partial [Rhododendron williamsianum]